MTHTTESAEPGDTTPANSGTSAKTSSSTGPDSSADAVSSSGAASAAASSANADETLGRSQVAVMVCVGLLAGFLAGLFGIGGGTIIVPALVLCGMTQRRAAATSLAAIVPTSLVGVVSYALVGNVDWIASILLAIGVVVGSQIGSWLLSRLPETVLRWAFVIFLLVVIVQQFLLIPSRDSRIDINVVSSISLIVMGVVIGILSGILGIGGGSIMVPALTVLFGASDLIARGTSLLAMLPGAASGTLANSKRHTVNIRAGLIVGVCACLLTPFGTWVAGLLTPQINSWLFAGYLIFLLVRSLWVAVRKH